jgi:hypothetical protein
MEKSMLTCPACGQRFDQQDVTALAVHDELECRRCRQRWAVASREPVRLEAAERELAFTD